MVNDDFLSDSARFIDDWGSSDTIQYGIYTDVDTESEKSLLLVPSLEILIELLPNIIGKVNNYAVFKLWGGTNDLYLVSDQLPLDKVTLNSLKLYIYTSLKKWKDDGTMS